MTARALGAAAALAALAALAIAGAPAGPPADADGFLRADRPWAFHFPADHASHPRFRIEWWYYTGHLAAPGRSFGYELTFFRVGLPQRRAASPSAWVAHDLVFEHLALTDETRRAFHSFETARRVALGLAGADSTRYHVWLGEASAGLAADGVTHELRGAAPDFALALALVPARPPVVHGEDGVSRKGPGPGQASHYYSLMRLATRGRVVVGGDTLAVNGTSWMDHEFTSSGLDTSLAGWDWFSVQLDDGRELMLYRLRRHDGGLAAASSGTLVEADGRVRRLALDDVRVRASGRWRSPRTGGEYPSGWVVEVPSARLALRLVPTLADQELVARSMGGVAYWEGSVRVEPEGAGPRGQGYVELTGYAGGAPY